MRPSASGQCKYCTIIEKNNVGLYTGLMISVNSCDNRLCLCKLHMYAWMVCASTLGFCFAKRSVLCESCYYCWIWPASWQKLQVGLFLKTMQNLSNGALLKSLLCLAMLYRFYKKKRLQSLIHNHMRHVRSESTQEQRIMLYKSYE